ncbi:MAG TPA: hypothetical protein ENN51_02125 [candidate division WOR-3 bacterium]|uniref:DUF2154 domain-containing protein n=1 Tax=candidate division WOR-3 bacterium TaxID=2052148 RepID=A0A7V0T507_UNCW3|nr:hypothetical protein [candidate division WOR-3 bacterium]
MLLIRLMTVVGLAGLAIAAEPVKQVTEFVQVSQRLAAGKAREVTVELAMSAGELEVRTGAEGLFELDCYAPDSSHAPALEYSEVLRAVEGDSSPVPEGEVQVYQPEIEETDAWQHRWNVRLDRERCRELDVVMGTGSVRLALAGSAVEELYVEVSVGELALDLVGDGTESAEGVFEADCEVGVGDIYIFVPAEAGVRVEAETEIGRVLVPDEFVETEEGWESPGWETSGRRIELVLSVAVGDVVVAAETVEE